MAVVVVVVVVVLVVIVVFYAVVGGDGVAVVSVIRFGLVVRSIPYHAS